MKNVTNKENTIEVSGISEVQALELMKNVASVVTQLEVCFGDYEEGDRRKDEVDKAREGLLNVLKALGTMHAYEVETNALIKADAIKDEEQNRH